MEYFLSETPEINSDLWSLQTFFCRICTFSHNETLTWEWVAVIAFDWEEKTKQRAVGFCKFRLHVTVLALAVEAVKANGGCDIPSGAGEKRGQELGYPFGKAQFGQSVGTDPSPGDSLDFIQWDAEPFSS